jgi:ATP-dependent RNA helicase DeaD
MSSEPHLTFSQLNLNPGLLQAVTEVGYETPTPIQAEAIPPLLEGKDLLGQAQTGTGKTAAFALPLLHRVDLSSVRPQILVLTPTRELAIQVAEAMQTYARHLKGFRVLPIYGGQSLEPQLRRLAKGVHAVVGTPGRILDHLRRGTLRLQNLQAVVLDEADEMLRMGFIDDVEEILSQAPKKRQVALFSATMPQVIKKVAHRHLNQPVEIKIKSKTVTVATVTQHYWKAVGVNKLDALTRILEVEDFDAMLVFVRTRNTTAQLAERLNARGFTSAPLSGEMSQSLRERTVDQLKKGSLDILVATDVAARGLDVTRISHVVNFDIPYDVEAYIHRIGRTGRAGREGKAILFVTPRERRMLFAIERATGAPLEAMHLPSRRDISDRRIQQFKQAISETIESQDLSFFEEVVGDYAKENEIGLGTVAAALAQLVQRERPLMPKTPQPKGAPAGGKAERPRPQFDPSSVSGKQTYRVEVGHQHQVLPKNIVGALANEGRFIHGQLGRLEIRDTYSLIDLPRDLPADLLKHLGMVNVCGQNLRIAPYSEARGADAPKHPRPAAAPRRSMAGTTKPTAGTTKPTARTKPPAKAKPKAKPKTTAKATASKGVKKEARGTRSEPTPLKTLRLDTEGLGTAQATKAKTTPEGKEAATGSASADQPKAKYAFSAFAARKAKKKATKKAVGKAKKAKKVKKKTKPSS